MAAVRHLLIVALFAALPLYADQCRTMQLNPAPRIFNIPIFDDSGDKLLLVDILGAAIDVYSLSGDLERTVKRPGSDSLDYSRPNTIFSAQSGYLVRDGGDRFVAMNRDFVPVRSFDAGATGVGAWDGAPFQWSEIDRGGIIAYGDFRMGNQPWKTGIFRFVPGERPQFLKEMPGGDAREPYLYEGRYVASIGRLGYVLSFSPEYGVFQIDGNGVRLLTGLPAGFGTLPPGPQSHGRSSMPVTYAALSRAKSISGMAVADGRLYLLLRNVANGRRSWFLAEYDPSKQATVSIIELPTSAEHVEIAAGKKWLAVVGKGPFLPEERFTPGDVTLVPIATLRALHASGGSVESPRKLCHG
jgi:hypothetical protein